MSEGAVSHGVHRLKELLFDSEAEHLADLSRRLDTLAAQQHEARRSLSERLTQEEGLRAELARRIESVLERAGSREQLTQSVSEILDQAIEKAESDRHDALARAVAPVVVKTIRTEILNSREALVEALYPMTGQMVKAYVASAMKDLVKQINRRLESNSLMLRIKSLRTGRSMAELALADSQRVEVEELLLIRRGTGELIARWPDKPNNNHDHVLGGVLTAINSFATEALESDEAALRQIDLGPSQLYLRSSPRHLLAAKCTGTAGRSIEQAMDEEFLQTVAALQGDGEAHALAHERLGDLGPRLEQRIGAEYEELDAPALGVSPARIVAVLVGVPLAAFFAWTFYTNYETNRVRDTARAVIETSTEIRGYPTTLAVTPRGRQVTVSGLAPSEAAADAVSAKLKAALPGSQIISQLAVMPGAAPDTSADVAALRRDLAALDATIPRRAAVAALARARAALAETGPQLARLAELAGQRSDGAGSSLARAARLPEVVAKALAAIPVAAGDLESARGDTGRTAGSLAAQNEALAALAATLARQGGMDVSDAASANDGRGTVPPVGAPAYQVQAERLEQIALNLRLITVALLQGEIIRAAQPKPVVVPPANRTPLDQLADFMRVNAIFFSEDVTYRDAPVAEEQIGRLAELIKQSDAIVRVAGYTDERGSNARNSTISQKRADRVRDALLARGVPAARLVAVGRMSQQDISPLTGLDSPNRRVEFEFGFRGEVGR